MLRGVGAFPNLSAAGSFSSCYSVFRLLLSYTRQLTNLCLPGCVLVLLALGACNTARALGEDAASHADPSAVHSIDLATLQKLTAFPSCVTSCATGALPHLWLSNAIHRTCCAGH